MLVTLLVLTAVKAMAQNIDDRTREGTEWAILRWERATDPTLPRVLLIGDSIANSYAARVGELLKGKANVDLLATSKSVCDPAFLLELTLATDGYKHAVIHFNNGLHGMHLSDAQYEAGLRRMVAKLRELAPWAKLVWGSSTSAVNLATMQLDANTNPKVIARNAAAARVMAELGVPVDDLYAVIVDHSDWHSDSLHFKAEGCAALGEAVTQAVSPFLVPNP